VARNNNKLPGLINQLTSTKVGGLNLSKSTRPTGVFGASPGGTQHIGKPPSPGGSRSTAMGAKDTATGIHFGHPSNARTSATPSGSAWTNLLKQSASGGVANALTGGLSSIVED